MKALLERVRREPAVVIGFVGAIIALAAAFGFDLTGEQTGAIMAFVSAGLAFVVRSQVTPTIAVGAAEQNDAAGADLVAGPASALPNETPVDVVPAEDVFGVGTDAARLVGRKDQAAYRDERGEMQVNGTLATVAFVMVIVCGAIFLLSLIF